MKRVTLILFLLALFGFASGQSGLLPDYDTDLEIADNDLQELELQVFQCQTISCPNVSCYSAYAIWRSVADSRDSLRIYAFWLSKIPDFRSNLRAQERYAKSNALIDRMSALIGNGEFDQQNPSKLGSCLSKLRPTCGEWWNQRNKSSSRKSCNTFVCKVVFPSTGEPSEGTASQPERWREALEAYSQRFGLRIGSHSGLVYEEDLWIEYPLEKAVAGIPRNARLMASQCSPQEQEIVLVPANSSRSAFDGSAPPLFSKRIQKGGEQWISFIVEEYTGPAEIRLVDVKSGSQLAFAPVFFETVVDLKGKWISDKGEEIEILVSGGSLAAYPARGQNRKALFWDIRVSGVDKSGSQSFSATCLANRDDREHSTIMRLFEVQQGEILLNRSDCKVSAYGNRFRRVN